MSDFALLPWFPNADKHRRTNIVEPVATQGDLIYRSVAKRGRDILRHRLLLFDPPYRKNESL